MRWLAIGTAPGWEDIEKFGDELSATSQWRPDPRTSISTVTALQDGRLLAECQGVSKEAFEKWLADKGWDVESITEVSHLARFGSVWKAR